jgi:large subunit ribosomal protein L25
MATHEIKVAKRGDQGKGASRRLRHADKIPAVVYGGELKPVSIELEHNDVWLASQHEWFYSSILDLSLEGDVQKVLLRDMQRHPAKPMHHAPRLPARERDRDRCACACRCTS